MGSILNRWYILFAAILLSGSSWIWISRLPVETASKSAEPSAVIGRLAPNFTLTTLAGETFELAALRGKPVVLNFWATWCGPCRAELPALEATAQQFENEVQIVAVDQAEAPETVQKYVDELALSFTIPLDREGSVGRLYSIRGLPTTFFIDDEGLIRHVWSGEMDRITLAELIAELLQG